jgi:16S rRNA C967 or C1407 C5-methylase (RsmB/RsmF family)/NOL1/NOP2/fmu family ribosome biogenesis protein
MSKYPQAFIDRMKVHLGSEFNAFITALDEPVTTSIRINPNKIVTTAFPVEMSIPWAQNGYYLAVRPSFTFDPLFHAGAYYVQESSSMFLEQAFLATCLQSQPIKVLDLCAAPGGKSTHLLSLINDQSLLVSNEVTANRNHILRQNLARWGRANVIVTQNRSEDFAKLGVFFDLIVIDAPCSGEGLFRKDKNAIGEWSEANVDMCAERQKVILANAIQCLKPGGYLIYSTCTFEEAENMANVRHLMNDLEMGCLPIKGADSYTELTAVSKDNAIGYAFYPHKAKGEGFFISLLKKKGDLRQTTAGAFNTNKDKLTGEFLSYVESHIKDADSFAALKHGQYYNILPAIFLSDYKTLSQCLYIRNAGISAGEIKGKDFIPAHELSLYQGFSNSFPSYELDIKTAISYLRAETISIPTDHRGWMAVKYQGVNLGFVKALPNRINNYFPKEWRILKAQP